MSVRRAEFARLEAAGWTMTVDSPWRRLGGWLGRRLGVLLVRLARRPVDTQRSTAAVSGWSR